MEIFLFLLFLILSRYALHDVHRAVHIIAEAWKMAPRNKFTREEMIEAAIQVIREYGYSALTALRTAFRCLS